MAKLEKNSEAKTQIEQVEEFLTDNYEIRFNTIALIFEYKDPQTKKWQELNENEIYVNIEKAGYKFSMAKLMYLLKSNYTPKYNPFRDFFDGLEAWDEVTDYIAQVAEYLSLGNEKERFVNMLQKWMVRSIACAFEDTFNKQALVIISGQNTGKSSFLRWLCPEGLRDYYKEDIGTDKDSKIAITTNFYINIDELSTLQKKDINTLKSILSSEHINERLPYDARNSKLHRHANFVASTDRSDFLSDDAGSVRWICFSVDSINWNYNKEIGINKVWAQAYYLYNSKFKYHLTREEIADNENYNLQFYIKGAEHEAILACFTRGTKEKHDRFITATEAIDLIKKNTMFYNPKMTSVAVGKAFRLLNFKIDTKYQSDMQYSIKGYYVKFTDLIPALPKPNTND